MDKLDLILEKLDAMDQKVDSLDQKVDSLDQKVDSLDQKVDFLDQKVDSLDQKVDCLDQRVDSMESDVKVIRLTLENEVRTNIMRVAEGHLDLSRNLKEAVRTNNEFEMLAIKVSMLETDVRELKRKIS